MAGEGYKASGLKFAYYGELFFLFHAAHVDFVYALGGRLAYAREEHAEAAVDLSCNAGAVVGLKVAAPAVSVA